MLWVRSSQTSENFTINNFLKFSLETPESHLHFCLEIESYVFVGLYKYLYILTESSDHKLTLETISCAEHEAFCLFTGWNAL